MNSEDFKKLVTKQLAEEAGLIENKGFEYTKGSKDRLQNFKGIGDEIGISPLHVWYIYFKKHIDSITSYVKFGKIKSNESIESRFTDARNYLMLGLALLQEAKNEKN